MEKTTTAKEAIAIDLFDGESAYGEHTYYTQLIRAREQQELLPIDPPDEEMGLCPGAAPLGRISIIRGADHQEVAALLRFVADHLESVLERGEMTTTITRRG
jgi:hypothetical protein